MTDFVLSAGNTIRPHRSPWGAFPVKGQAISTGISSNQIAIGTVVQLDASTNNQIFPVALSSRSLNPSANSVVGVAAEATQGGGTTTNARGTVISVWDANPMVEFKAWTRFGLLDSTIIGQPKELTRDSTLGIDLVNLSASSLATPAKCVIITSLIDSAGDSGGAVTFRFNTSSGFLAFYR